MQLSPEGFHPCDWLSQQQHLNYTCAPRLPRKSSLHRREGGEAGERGRATALGATSDTRSFYQRRLHRAADESLETRLLDAKNGLWREPPRPILFPAIEAVVGVGAGGRALAETAVHLGELTDHCATRLGKVQEEKLALAEHSAVCGGVGVEEGRVGGVELGDGASQRRVRPHLRAPLLRGGEQPDRFMRSRRQHIALQQTPC